MKAARYIYFLGVNRYSPNAGVLGDVGLDPVLAKQRKTVTNQWMRMRSISDDRLDHKVFIWSEQSLGRYCKNWNFRVRNILTETDFYVPRVDSHSENIVDTAYNFVINDHHENLPI